MKHLLALAVLVCVACAPPLPALASQADDRWPLILVLVAMVAAAAHTSLKSFVEVAKGIRK